MAMYTLLDDAVRARFSGDGWCTSSGSDHDASVCLSDLFQAFLETDAAGGGEEDGAGPVPKGGDSDDEDGLGRAAETTASVRELLDSPAAEDPFRIRLAAIVAAALDAEAPLLRAHDTAFQRAVMRRLRVAGYDVGVCWSCWEASGGLTAGTYEYVDVVVRTASAAKGTKRTTRRPTRRRCFA